MVVKLNAVRCLLCGDVIASWFTHDYVTCKCESVSVDGGSDYKKRSWKAGMDIKDCILELDWTSGEDVKKLLTKKKIKNADGSPVTYEKVLAVMGGGPKSPAFYLDLDVWRNDAHIWSQVVEK